MYALTCLFFLVTNQELAALWNLFESLQSRSTDKYGLDQDIFFRFINLTVSNSTVKNVQGLWAIRLFHVFSGG